MKETCEICQQPWYLYHRCNPLLLGIIAWELCEQLETMMKHWELHWWYENEVMDA